MFHIITAGIDVSQIIQIVNGVGFPIVCAGALFWYMIKQNETHKKETDELTEVIRQNTSALAELTIYIRKGEE